MAKTLCIYHANCADGLGAAWAVHRALGADVEFVAAKYGDQHKLLTSAECVASGKCPSQEDIPRACMICDGGLGYCKKCYRAEIELDQPCGIPSIIGRDVLIVDFSYPLAALRAMAQVARSVLVIDHHKTAQEDLKPICDFHMTYVEWQKNPLVCDINGIRNLAAIFDMNRSGAGLTWDYLYPAIPDRRPSFNVGSGTVKEGDTAIYQGKECKVLTVYHDGDVQIDIGNGTFPTVKWRHVIPTTSRSNPASLRPHIIDLIEDRDLWKFRFGYETRAFHAVLTSYDITDLPAMFERLDRWDAAFRRHNFTAFRRHNFISGDVDTSREHPTLTIWETICSEGMAILRAQRQQVASTVVASRRTMKIADHTVPCANVPPSMASDAGHLLCEPTDGPSTLGYPDSIIVDDGVAQENWCYFSATYYDGADGKRHFSLRSPEGGADVGHIAKAMAEKFNNNQFEKYRGTAWSGGGHEHAAGFDAPLGWEGE